MPDDYRILRYPLELTEYQELSIGWPAEVLTVAIGKDGDIDLWAMVLDEQDSRHDPVTVPIYIVGTGHPMPREIEPDNLGAFSSYLGTVVMDRYVWHIFTGRQRT
ncbi:MAG TPA: hypothetical protein VMS84_07940 [Mycobacterium sp.]|jgi:hypothetical protein|nr:hypothetical protein [Mycobacterium sp.]